MLGRVAAGRQNPPARPYGPCWSPSIRESEAISAVLEADVIASQWTTCNIQRGSGSAGSGSAAPLFPVPSPGAPDSSPEPPAGCVGARGEAAGPAAATGMGSVNFGARAP